MLNNPKISIIVPVYNPPEDYLRECLDSLINQSLKEIEIILIDNNSRGISPKILQQYANKDERIVLFRFEENQGASGAVNQGIKLARAEYFQIVDSDDYIALDTCETLHNIVSSYQTDLIVFNAQDVAGTNTRKRTKSYLEMLQTPNFNQVFSIEEAQNLYFQTSLQYWNKLYKRSVVIDNHNFLDNDLKFVLCDVLFCCYHFFNSQKIMFFDKILYHYHSANESGIIAHYKLADCPYLEAPFIFQKKIENYINKRQLSARQASALVTIVLKHFYMFFAFCHPQNKKYFYNQLKSFLLSSDNTIYAENNYEKSGLKIWCSIIKWMPYELFKILKINVKINNQQIKLKIGKMTIFRQFKKSI